MIIEQTKLFGIIPISKAKPVEPGTKIPLEYRLIADLAMSTYAATVSKLLEIVNAENVKLHEVTNGVSVTYLNDTPLEINQMNLHTQGCFTQNVYRYVPSKK
jgi:hypothetical protein